MAKRTAMKNRSKKKSMKRKSGNGATRRPTRGATPRRASKSASSRRAPSRRSNGSAPRPAKIREGVITHTELASTDPMATREWCEAVLGWEFGEAMPSSAGPYHMWRFGIGTGGGIRSTNPPEPPGSLPYCEVKDIKTTYANAVAAGATPMMPPEALPGSMGWIAIVTAPGGVPIGFWSMGK